jgi:cobalt-zinc-cadmium efflux system protein
MNEHSHPHHHGEPAQGSAIAAAILLNGGFIVAEIMYGLQAHSLSLLADAGHNASDVMGLAMAWGAIILAKRKPSSRFTYGLQSASIFAALANALLLMVAVGGIGLEAVQRFGSPETPASMTVIAVALAGMFINGGSAMLLHTHQHDLNMRGAFVHMAADAAVSLGVAASGLVIMGTGWLWLDPLVSLAISLFIVVTTWRLLRQSVHLALHAVPSHIETDEVRAWLLALDGVQGVHDLHIWAMSTTGVALSAHMLMPGGHPGDAFIETVAHGLEHRFAIGHATLQIETGHSGHCHTGCAS